MDSVKPDAPDQTPRTQRAPASSHVDPAGNRNPEQILEEGDQLKEDEKER
jgi:hypothetical protein